MIKLKEYIIYLLFGLAYLSIGTYIDIKKNSNIEKIIKNSKLTKKQKKQLVIEEKHKFKKRIKLFFLTFFVLMIIFFKYIS